MFPKHIETASLYELCYINRLTTTSTVTTTVTTTTTSNRPFSHQTLLLVLAGEAQVLLITRTATISQLYLVKVIQLLTRSFSVCM